MKIRMALLPAPATLVFLCAGTFPSCGGEAPPRTVHVARGTVVRNAVAVGRIEPEFEVPVKSRHGGVVTRRFVMLGQKVKEGDPLVEVRPIVTDLDRLAAERAILSAHEAEQSVLEFQTGANLMGRFLQLMQGGESLKRMREGASRARASAEEQLQLLVDGHVEIEGKIIDWVVRSPAEGHVIQFDLDDGQPIVPSSSYGSGTVLMILADMDQPVFRGEVDEIDVGRLSEGMTASIEIGALPGEPLQAKLSEISLRARERNNAVVFDVKLRVVAPEEMTLRAGYSAVARIEVARAEDILVLPERVVDFRPDGAWVRLDEGGGDPVSKRIETGLSDGLTVEITSGLSEGDVVLEPSS